MIIRGKHFFSAMVILYVLMFNSAYTQITSPGDPTPLSYTRISDIPVYEISIPEVPQGEEHQRNRDERLKVAGSGFIVPVDYYPGNSGVWDTLNNDNKIWRAAFHVKGARYLSIWLKPYRVNKGVKVFIYDVLQQNVAGAFSSINNKSINSLATTQIPGEYIVVEMQMPAFVREYGSFVISGIGCDTTTDSGMKGVKDTWYGSSGSCNIDINCYNIAPYKTIKNSVVRIVYDGGYRCTGTLVNNTLNDKHNYVLTAEHCINDELTANTAVFYFGYESPYCDGPDAEHTQSVSGSSLIATGGTLDFTLLEILEPIPFEYHPYYAGWDYSGTPPESSFAIHHPQGDVKKISFENDVLTTTSYITDYLPYTHWLVNAWDEGTTEGGSSGCPIFNYDGYIVGTLTGGWASCTHPEFSDYFQKFDRSWDYFSSPDQQLKYWLDPMDLDPGTFSGYEPYADFWQYGDTLSNMQSGDLLVTENVGLSWGSYSGHNSDYLTGFSEVFEISSAKKIFGTILHVADNYVAYGADFLTLKVWNGTDLPEYEVYSQQVLYADLVAENMNFVIFDSIIDVSTDFFIGYELQYGVPQDTFATYMAKNRAVSQVNTAYVKDGGVWESLSGYTGNAIFSSFDIQPVIYDSLTTGISTPESLQEVVLFPNPANTHLIIELPESVILPVRVTVYNIQGQVVIEDYPEPSEQQYYLNMSGLMNGLYVVRIITGSGKFYSAKVAVSNTEN